MLIGGEAGIGKTVLWQAVAARARARGYCVLSCRCEQAEAQLSFVGLADLIGGAAPRVLDALPELQRQALAAALLREAPQGGGDLDPRTVATGFTAAVANLAGVSPVVIAIDDVPWLDAPTARVLSFALRRLAGSHVGWLCTSRTPAAITDPLSLERSLDRHFTRVELGPLTAGDLRMLLDRRQPRTHTRTVLARIIDASGGNPLFAQEIANALASKAENATRVRAQIPESVRALVSERISRLRTGARAALLAASAMSHPTLAILERASSPAAVAEAEETDLLEVDGERVRFRHPLYASAVYERASTSRRRKLHRRLADLLEDEEERARHLAMTTQAPNEGVALALEGAAARARARGAWDAAADLLEGGTPHATRAREPMLAPHRERGRVPHPCR